MKCARLDELPILFRRRRRCVACEGPDPTQMCDWKTGRGTTCDALLCATCAEQPAPGKDLCPTHAAMWRVQRRLRGKK